MSKGIGIIQQLILNFSPIGEEISTDYLRSKIYPELYKDKNSNEMNAARVTIHRAIKSLIHRGFLKPSGKNNRGCVKIIRTIVNH